MTIPTRFAKLRADPTLSRAQDAIDPILRGQGQALSQTPLMGSLPVWTPFQLATVFSNLGSPFATAAYYKDGFNVVRAKGALASSAGCAAGTTIGTFPAGFRPAETHRLSVRGNVGNSQCVIVAPTGVATVDLVVPPGGSLDFEFSFLAEQ